MVLVILNRIIRVIEFCRNIGIFDFDIFASNENRGSVSCPVLFFVLKR